MKTWVLYACTVYIHTGTIITNSYVRNKFGLLLGVNEKLLTQHISGLVTKYKLLYVSNQAWVRVWARARHCHLLT